MENPGRKYEVLKPEWTGSLIGGIILTLLSLPFLIVLPSFIKIFPLIFFAAGIYSSWKAFQLKDCHVTFYDYGLGIRVPGSEDILLSRDVIEDFSWEADETSEIEHGFFYNTHSRREQITFSLSYEDENQGFQEIQWTGSFASGTIRRLHRAIEMADERMDAAEQQSTNKEEYWDE
jgi:hypothetical protein